MGIRIWRFWKTAEPQNVLSRAASKSWRGRGMAASRPFPVTRSAMLQAPSQLATSTKTRLSTFWWQIAAAGMPLARHLERQLYCLVMEAANSRLGKIWHWGTAHLQSLWEILSGSNLDLPMVSRSINNTAVATCHLAAAMETARSRQPFPMRLARSPGARRHGRFSMEHGITDVPAVTKFQGLNGKRAVWQ